DDDARFSRNLVPVRVDRTVFVLAGFANEAIGLAAALAAPEAPRRHAVASGLGDVPTAGDEIAHLDVEAEPAAELAGARRIGSHSALFDDDREALLQRFDRAVAHIALADGAGRGRTVLIGPAAPAATFCTLHDEALAALVEAEERHVVAHRALMRGRRH